jgi:hypothetical protein
MLLIVEQMSNKLKYIDESDEARFQAAIGAALCD